jgi:hypothetical protein
MSTITAKIQLRRDTSANWTANNPILLAGEMALSTDVLYTGTDQPRHKIGNGVDTWSNLDYVPEGSAAYPENLFLTVVNKTGDNLLASGYKVVKVSSAQGQRLAVDYALADSDANSADTIGIVYENILNNETGKLVVIGELSGLNTTGSLQTETWTDGDLLFLSPFVDGGITNIRPTAPNHSVIIGYVVYAHANNGKIYCKIDNGYEIGELHNCYLPSPNNNDGIFWSSGTTRYENKSIVQALGYTPYNTYFASSSTTNPVDATIYYLSFNFETLAITDTVRQFSFDRTEVIKEVSLIILQATNGSNETVNVYLRNLTTATDYLIGTFTSDFGANQSKTFLYTGLNINVNSTDNWSFKILTPTWTTNPTSWRIGIRAKTN